MSEVCLHPRESLAVRVEDDRCCWVACLQCGRRGPKKSTQRKAVAAWDARGTAFRGARPGVPVHYANYRGTPAQRRTARLQ